MTKKRLFSILVTIAFALICFTAAFTLTVLCEKKVNFIILLLSVFFMALFVLTMVTANRAAKYAACRKEEQNAVKENQKKKLMAALDRHI